VQLTRAFGATAIAISRSQPKLDLALQLGAAHAVRSDDDTIANVRALTGGLGADVVLQCADSVAAYEMALSLAGPGGRIVLVGSSAEPFRVPPMQMIWSELSLLGSRGFVQADIAEAIQLRLDGRIVVDHLVRTIRPLEEAQGALDDLRAGLALRTVLVP
jgi:threonine dehydrogenase-like Zn-dependent dehydrogenase